MSAPLRTGLSKDERLDARGSTGSPRAEMYRTVMRSSLEIPTGAEFHESRLNDRDRSLPGGAERVVLDENRVRVERVVQVDVQIHAAVTDADDLREAEIEFIQSVAKQRTRLDQIDVGLPQRERPAERGCGADINGVRGNLRPRNALEGATEANAVRHRIRGKTFVLRKERRLLVTVLLRRPRAAGCRSHQRLNAGRRGGNRRLRRLGHIVDDVAVVGHGLAGADATLHE